MLIAVEKSPTVAGASCELSQKKMPPGTAIRDND